MSSNRTSRSNSIMTTLTTQISSNVAETTLSLPPRRKHVNVTLYSIALHTSLAGLLYGLDTGSIGPITEMPQFHDSVGEFSDITQGIYVSSILLFAAISSVGNGYLADRFGRKYTIFLGAVLASLGATISSSVSNLAVLFVARAIYGMAIGLSFSTTTVYLIEIAPANQRGLLGCMAQLLITIGIAAAYFTAYASVGLSGSLAWRIPFIVQACVGVVLAIGLLFVPFSPRWLMQKGREAEAMETLRKLHNVDSNDLIGMHLVRGELAEIRNDIQFDVRVRQSTSYIEIFHRVKCFSPPANLANPSTHPPLSLCHGIPTTFRGMFLLHALTKDRCDPILRTNNLLPSRLPIKTRKFPRLRNLRNYKLCLHDPSSTLR
jgi:MFS family permease